MGRLDQLDLSSDLSKKEAKTRLKTAQERMQALRLELAGLDGEGKVARFFDYRGEGSFTGLQKPIAELARDEAVFRVRRLQITPKG